MNPTPKLTGLLLLTIVVTAACGDDTNDTAQQTTTPDPATNPTDQTSTTATTEIISPHMDCYDTYLAEPPTVTSAQQYYANPGDEIQLARTGTESEPTNHALFILDETGTAQGAVKFSYSPQDVLTVHDVRDADCEPADWTHAGNDTNTTEGQRTQSSNITPTLEDTPHDITLTVAAELSTPGGEIIRRDYLATINNPNT